MANNIVFCFLLLSYSSLILGIRSSRSSSANYYTSTNRYTTTTRNVTTTTATTATTTTIKVITITTTKPYTATATKTTTKPYTTATAAKAAVVAAPTQTTYTTTTRAVTTTASTTAPSLRPLPALTQNSFDIQQMACLVNYQRKLKGAAPLTISSGINKIALGHSIWQAQTNNMTHYGANGSTLINRFDSANYPSKYVSENVAWNQRSSVEVVQAWVNSPSHYVNMINPSYTEFGCTSVNWYWTFDFGSSSGVGNTIPNCSGYQIP